MDGVLLLDKPAGMTSHDCVNIARKVLKTKKVGHTGTLDPIATGVLVITVGRYTKLNEVLMSTYKEYISEFKLGVLTDTLDITGNVLKSENVSLAKEEIKNAIMSFHGSYMQSVPHYSAVKVNGKKLYEYARKGQTVTLVIFFPKLHNWNLPNKCKVRSVLEKSECSRDLEHLQGNPRKFPQGAALSVQVLLTAFAWFIAVLKQNF